MAFGPKVMQAPTLAASRNGQGTLLVGSIPDQSALYGLIHQLEALGLQLLEIRRTVPVPERQAPLTRRTQAHRLKGPRKEHS